MEGILCATRGRVFCMISKQITSLFSRWITEGPSHQLYATKIYSILSSCRSNTDGTRHMRANFSITNRAVRQIRERKPSVIWFGQNCKDLILDNIRIQQLKLQRRSERKPCQKTVSFLRRINATAHQARAIMVSLYP